MTVMASAVLVVDMLNPYDHEDADRLVASVRSVLPAMRELLARARDEGVPIVYVNDNQGDWSACRAELVERALQGRAPELIEPIAPPPDVGFVVKARHSIFYQTQLEYLLRQEEIDRVVLAGQVTEQCILYSALDAYVRHFAVAVPHDAVAHIHTDLGDAALQMMGRNMRADVCAAAECSL
jgi:nicotinamidase-related amidase